MTNLSHSFSLNFDSRAYHQAFGAESAGEFGNIHEVKPIEGLVDVLVPTYQHEQYIRECIDSIFAQDYGNFLVHVFDDFSTDGTAHELEQLQAKWGSRLRVYRNLERQGSGSASILHQAPNLRGEFWAVVEGDDFWLTSDKLTKQVSILKSNPQAVAAASKTEMRNELTGEIIVIEPDVREWNYFDLILNSDRFRHYAHISGILWRNIYPGQNVPYPKNFSRPNAVRGEVILMHEVLRETRGSVILYDEVTSVYRFTGSGIWSSLTEDQRREKNEVLNQVINARRPMWLKAIAVLRLPKILDIWSLN